MERQGHLTSPASASNSCQGWDFFFNLPLVLTQIGEITLMFYLFIFYPCPSACGILVPWPGIEPSAPVVEVWSLNHWTAREVHHGWDLTSVASWLFRWLSGKEPTCQCRRLRKCSFNLCIGKIPWSRKWLHTQVFLPEKSHGQRSLAGYSPWGWKESDMIKQPSMQAHGSCSKAFAFPSNLWHLPQGSDPPWQPRSSTAPPGAFLENTALLPHYDCWRWGSQVDPDWRTRPLHWGPTVRRVRSPCAGWSGLGACALVPHMGTHVIVATAAGRDRGVHMLQRRVPAHTCGLSYVYRCTCLYNEIIIIADTSQCLSSVWCFINYG